MRLEAAKGVLFLDALRRRMGDDTFLKLMSDYFAANTTKTVTAQSFLTQAGVPFSLDVEDGPAYVTTDIERRLRSAMLVYGTVREAGANRYAAEELQKQFLDRYESVVPIRKDFEVTGMLTNCGRRTWSLSAARKRTSALAAWSERLWFGLSRRRISNRPGSAHASERVMRRCWRGRNPLNAAHMVLVVAGNVAVRTVILASAPHAWKAGEYEFTEDGRGTPGFWPEQDCGINRPASPGQIRREISDDLLFLRRELIAKLFATHARLALTWGQEAELLNFAVHHTLARSG